LIYYLSNWIYFTADPAAFDIGISNLIEVTQTRSAYGHVMNKRAMRGGSSSDTNDRSEPYVGAMVVSRMYVDSLGTPRQATMQWVVEMLFPTLLRWNEWVWETRRYNVGQPGGGLVVLGIDESHVPCEGSTVGLNSSRLNCSRAAFCKNEGCAILESGMDNSPMYLNAFDSTPPTAPAAGDDGAAAPGDGSHRSQSTTRIPASFDAAKGRLQLYDVQQSALFVSEARALQKLAAVSGNSEAIPQLKTRADSMAALINGLLWDEATGIYRQVDASPAGRGFSPAISPTSFYPMIAGMAGVDQAERMVKGYLTNASEFCVRPNPLPPASFSSEGVEHAVDSMPAGASGPRASGDIVVDEAGSCPYAVPSISRSDPNFPDNNYWRGRAWGPLNLLTWVGLSAPEYANVSTVAAARKGLCQQSMDLLLGEWRTKRHVHENYNADTGQGCDSGASNPFYHWGANLGYIAMRESIAASPAPPVPTPVLASH
jgi:hypothetical protein